MELNVVALALAIDQLAKDLSPDERAFKAPFDIRRRRIEMKIIAASTKPELDPTLHRALAKAYLWVDAIRSGVQIAELAQKEGHSESDISTRAVLAFLSPKYRRQFLLVRSRWS